MKTLISIAAVVAVAGGAAHAFEFSTICARGDDERLIEIVSPGEVGQMCDVRYSRDNGANVRTPYHANNSAAFCLEKANELVFELQGSGFNCVAADGTLITGAVEEPAPAAPEEIAAEPASDFVMEATRAPQADAGPAALTPAQAAPAEAAVEDEAALLARMNEILTEPAQEPAAPPPAQDVAEAEGLAAASGPTDLTPLAEAPPAEETPTLAGAAPVEPAAESAPEPAPEPVTQAAAPTPATPVSTATPAFSRRPEDVVRATVEAQAAAWNEGDLDAFMDIYARDDDLTFISNGDVASRGWSATMRRYRERYGGAGGMGRIGFDDLRTNMVTEDVAIVTGKVRHVIDGQSSSGAFSLVMKRNDGVWRIVHDHTSADAETAGN